MIQEKNWSLCGWSESSECVGSRDSSFFFIFFRKRLGIKSAFFPVMMFVMRGSSWYVTCLFLFSRFFESHLSKLIHYLPHLIPLCETFLTGFRLLKGTKKKLCKEDHETRYHQNRLDTHSLLLSRSKFINERKRKNVYTNSMRGNTFSWSRIRREISFHQISSFGFTFLISLLSMQSYGTHIRLWIMHFFCVSCCVLHEADGNGVTQSHIHVVTESSDEKRSHCIIIYAVTLFTAILSPSNSLD